MSRAEEAALKAYPIKGEWVGNQYGEWDNDINRPKRNAFLQGYEQAEKDLGWISIKDRLPEEGHFVLTCVADTGTPQCVGMALLLNDGTWWDGDIKVRVDYWMEVPQLKENNYGM